MANVSEAAGSYTLVGEWSQEMIDNLNTVKLVLEEGEYNTILDSDFTKVELSWGFQGNGRGTYSENLSFAPQECGAY